VGKNGNKKLMSEIMTTEKMAMENWAAGKSSNGKIGQQEMRG